MASSRYGIAVRAIVALAWAVFLLCACASGGTGSGDTVVPIAVWDVESLNPAGNAQTGMVEIFTGQIMARLGENKSYQVVERQQLLKAMEELSIGSSELADPGTRLKLGRLLGAKQMVFGAFQQIGGQVRLDLRRVDVSTGKILKTANAMAAAGDINSWITAADQLAKSLVE